jgi:hypothetical protein
MKIKTHDSPECNGGDLSEEDVCGPVLNGARRVSICERVKGGRATHGARCDSASHGSRLRVKDLGGVDPRDLEVQRKQGLVSTILRPSRGLQHTGPKESEKTIDERKNIEMAVRCAVSLDAAMSAAFGG